MAELVRISTHMLEAAGWAVIMIAVAASTIAYVRRVRVSGFEASYRGYRADLGRGILLGLELLIAADILKTVVIDPTLIGLAVLGGIVFIRTFLSFSLDVEINGHWPWETTRLQQQVEADQRGDAVQPAGPA
jgi:uncharacterized membrane protein